jgi:hypothetical protein
MFQFLKRHIIKATSSLRRGGEKSIYRKLLSVWL